MAHLLDAPGPYTLFAPTGEALNAMKEGYLDFLLTEQVPSHIENLFVSLVCRLP